MEDGYAKAYSSNLLEIYYFMATVCFYFPVIRIKITNRSLKTFGPAIFPFFLTVSVVICYIYLESVLLAIHALNVTLLIVLANSNYDLCVLTNKTNPLVGIFCGLVLLVLVGVIYQSWIIFAKLFKRWMYLALTAHYLPLATKGTSSRCDLETTRFSGGILSVTRPGSRNGRRGHVLPLSSDNLVHTKW